MSCVKNNPNTNSNNNGTSTSGKKKRASLDSLDLSSSYESLSPDQVEGRTSPKTSDVDLSWLAYLVPGNRCRVTRSGVKLPVVVKSAALMKQPWTICPVDKKHHNCHHHQEHSAAKRSSCQSGMTGIQRRLQ